MNRPEPPGLFGVPKQRWRRRGFRFPPRLKQASAAAPLPRPAATSRPGMGEGRRDDRAPWALSDALIRACEDLARELDATNDRTLSAAADGLFAPESHEGPTFESKRPR